VPVDSAAVSGSGLHTEACAVVATPPPRAASQLKENIQLQSTTKVQPHELFVLFDKSHFRCSCAEAFLSFLHLILFYRVCFKRGEQIYLLETGVSLLDTRTCWSSLHSCLPVSEDFIPVHPNAASSGEQQQVHPQQPALSQEHTRCPCKFYWDEATRRSLFPLNSPERRWNGNLIGQKCDDGTPDMRCEENYGPICIPLQYQVELIKADGQSIVTLIWDKNELNNCGEWRRWTRATGSERVTVTQSDIERFLKEAVVSSPLQREARQCLPESNLTEGGILKHSPTHLCALSAAMPPMPLILPLRSRSIMCESC
jgi:hypothetical protein